MKRLDGKPKVTNKEAAKGKFLNKARKVHGEKYEYPDEYVNCKQPIKILCPEHGGFKQTPDSHIQGKGCSLCANNKGGVKYSNDEIINRFEEIHGDVYDYSDVKYINMATKVRINCRIHGFFDQVPSSHLSGCGCNKCAHKGLTEYDFKTFLLGKHKGNCEYVSGFVSMNQPCIFSCNKHGHFIKSPSDFMQKKWGCKDCANIEIGVSLSLGKDLIISDIESLGLFELIEVVKNGDSYNSKTKIKVRCLTHNTVEVRNYENLMKSKGCKICAEESKSSKRFYSNETFIMLSKQKYGDKFDYSKTHYVRSSQPVIITCRKHGDLVVRPNSHLSKETGCSKCLHRGNSWSRSGFVKFVDKKYGGKCKLYLIECSNNHEKFIKVGITCRSVKQRFSTKTQMPYDFSEVFITTESPEMVYDIEKNVINKFKMFKHQPQFEFGGKTECFNYDKKSEILSFIEESFNA